MPPDVSIVGFNQISLSKEISTNIAFLPGIDS